MGSHCTPARHQKGDEQPPEAAVAVEERVNGLELDVRETA